MKQCEVVDMSVETVSLAINLGERYQLSHWDSLIIASALDAGCDTLYSEDMQNGQVFEDRLKVDNPFVSSAGKTQG
jgi:predicted nucleic acid-binding protein